MAQGSDSLLTFGFNRCPSRSSNSNRFFLSLPAKIFDNSCALNSRLFSNRLCLTACFTELSGICLECSFGFPLRDFRTFYSTLNRICPRRIGFFKERHGFNLEQDEENREGNQPNNYLGHAWNDRAWSIGINHCSIK